MTIDQKEIQAAAELKRLNKTGALIVAFGVAGLTACTMIVGMPAGNGDISYKLVFQSKSDPSSTASRTSSERELGQVLSGQTVYQWQQRCYGCYAHM